jgi:hypothetical protein
VKTAKLAREARSNRESISEQSEMFFAKVFGLILENFCTKIKAARLKIPGQIA